MDEIYLLINILGGNRLLSMPVCGYYSKSPRSMLFLMFVTGVIQIEYDSLVSKVRKVASITNHCGDDRGRLDPIKGMLVNLCRIHAASVQ